MRGDDGATPRSRPFEELITRSGDRDKPKLGAVAREQGRSRKFWAADEGGNVAGEEDQPDEASPDPEA
jgi:hypothetical protein